MPAPAKVLVGVLGLIVVFQTAVIVWMARGTDKTPEILTAAPVDSSSAGAVDAAHAVLHKTPLPEREGADEAETSGEAEAAGEAGKSAAHAREQGVISEAIEMMLLQPSGELPGPSGQTARAEHAGVSPEAAARARDYLDRARQASENGDFEQARALLRRGIAANPGDRQVYRELAELNRHMGFTDEEIQTYQEWSEAMPKDALPHYMLAQTYDRLGWNDEAVAELDRFRAMSGDSVESYAMTAGVYRDLGMLDEEGAMLDAWIGAAPDSMAANRAYGDYLLRTGDRQGALDAYETAIAVNAGGTVKLRCVRRTFHARPAVRGGTGAISRRSRQQPEQRQPDGASRRCVPAQRRL